MWLIGEALSAGSGSNVVFRNWFRLGLQSPFSRTAVLAERCQYS